MLVLTDGSEAGQTVGATIAETARVVMYAWKLEERVSGVDEV